MSDCLQLHVTGPVTHDEGSTWRLPDGLDLDGPPIVSGCGVVSIQFADKTYILLGDISCNGTMNCNYTNINQITAAWDYTRCRWVEHETDDKLPRYYINIIQFVPSCLLKNLTGIGSIFWKFLLWRISVNISEKLSKRREENRSNAWVNLLVSLHIQNRTNKKCSC